MNPAAARGQPETPVQRREAAHLLRPYGLGSGSSKESEPDRTSGYDGVCSGCVAGSGDRERFLRANAETLSANARMTTSATGDFVQLAGRKTKGNEDRHEKKQTTPKARMHIKTIRGHLGVHPVKGNHSNWRKAAGSCLIQ
ncbi:MAG: hypothetical protein AUH11_13185 [Acidobacteria bacterium 13_2_20CM_57_17]|nr:MAG: hypothetical protein AUH11_13185 [Acidobacteria bacterium 13_2_20CM_57_17]OLE16672.1 MAG: hypothetical protein AUG83_02140 [Acidobacteria bacterium 13_1_20CM_4_57_11]